MSTVLTRRTAVRGGVIAAVGAIAGFVVARNSRAADQPNGTTAANAYGADPSSGGRALVAVADIPVGGGKIISDPPVVVVRTGQETVIGFSAICTHQGCTVSSISDGTIDCPCHGSKFDLHTGRVVSSPATRPLPRVPLVVRNAEVFTS